MFILLSLELKTSELHLTTKQNTTNIMIENSDRERREVYTDIHVIKVMSISSF